ncbi:hypothetical protein BD311DRAFT_349616 [Dichomitus squalens]|uniref:Uncharacterized protein n=1 Tax=Dichomitus squalens TaxID=114155 RepID=A0A4Q9N328_9APHY|nr:hypothetical protein BD311DRAFT_349616 [Dichomitus squalens]
MEDETSNVWDNSRPITTLSYTGSTTSTGKTCSATALDMLSSAPTVQACKASFRDWSSVAVHLCDAQDYVPDTSIHVSILTLPLCPMLLLRLSYLKFLARIDLIQRYSALRTSRTCHTSRTCSSAALLGFEILTICRYSSPLPPYRNHVNVSGPLHSTTLSPVL